MSNEPTGGELRRCQACDSWMLADAILNHRCHPMTPEDTPRMAERTDRQAQSDPWKEAAWFIEQQPRLQIANDGQTLSRDKALAALAAARSADAALLRERDAQIDQMADAIALMNQQQATDEQQIASLTAQVERLKGVFSRMSLVDDDMGIYMAGTQHPDGSFTPRDGFGDGWNAAVSQYGTALLAEAFELLDAGEVRDLGEDIGGDGEKYGELVAFLRRAKRAEAESVTLRAERDDYKALLDAMSEVKTCATTDQVIAAEMDAAVARTELQALREREAALHAEIAEKDDTIRHGDAEIDACKREIARLTQEPFRLAQELSTARLRLSEVEAERDAAQQENQTLDILLAQASQASMLNRRAYLVLSDALWDRHRCRGCGAFRDGPAGGHAAGCWVFAALSSSPRPQEPQP